MVRDAALTRARIVEAAAKLFYREGIRRVSVDAVAEAAGVTKRTLYHHFDSKDELVTAYLEAQDNSSLRVLQDWFDGTSGDLSARIEGLFSGLARSARHPKWSGCGFLRTAAELVATPGHPAMKVGSRHKRGVESWLAGVFVAHGVPEAQDVARQVVVLMDGAFSTMLVHRDPAYIEAAGRAAAFLVAVPRAEVRPARD